MATEPEDGWLPLSALQHLLFCERQCALIHIERVWADNALTSDGQLLHRNVDQEAPRFEQRGALRITRGLPIRSRRLALSGIADVVEFHHDPLGVELPKVRGRWRPFPVEYKRGRLKVDPCDAVQLCGQALCLEEMLQTEVSRGALFYGKTQRRFEVIFDSALRSRTEAAAARLHELFTSGSTPPAIRDKKCDRCSLLELCMPANPQRDTASYLRSFGLEPQEP